MKRRLVSRFDLSGVSPQSNRGTADATHRPVADLADVDIGQRIIACIENPVVIECFPLIRTSRRHGASAPFAAAAGNTRRSAGEARAPRERLARET
jgi:hypothetical protein